MKDWKTDQKEKEISQLLQMMGFIAKNNKFNFLLKLSTITVLTISY